MRKVKILTILCSIICLFSSFTLNVTSYADFQSLYEIYNEAELYSDGVYMVNLDTGTVIISKNADKKQYPLSTTKIMTCLVALENIKDFNEIVSVPYDCFNEFFEGNPNYSNVSNAEIAPLQDNLTYWDCLYALMLPSACEAANVIAYNVSGSLEAFTALMNETAQKIGCTNTHFDNAHGLFTENNYTTAYDMYLITKYALDNYEEGFMRICTTTEYEMPANKYHANGYTITSTNQLMSQSSPYYTEGVQGIKTGTISRYYYKKDGKWDESNYERGTRALVSTAQRNGYRYLVVTLGAPYYNDDGTVPDVIRTFQDHKNLYNWAFSEFEYTQIISKNQEVMQAKVEKGEEADHVGLVTTESFSTLLPKSTGESAVQKVLPAVPTLTAPVTAGTTVGEIELRLNGEVLSKIPLVTNKSINLDPVVYYREKISDFFHNPLVIAGIAIIIVLIVGLTAAGIVNRKHRKKQAELQRRRKINMSPKSGSGNGRNNRYR